MSIIAETLKLSEIIKPIIIVHAAGIGMKCPRTTASQDGIVIEFDTV
jgi:hypothetical protein